MRGPNILHHTPLCLDPVLEFWLLPAGQEVFPPTQPPSHLRPPVTGRPGQSPHPPPPAPACPGGKQLTDSPSPEFPAGSGNLASLGEVTRVPLADPSQTASRSPQTPRSGFPLNKQAGRLYASCPVACLSHGACSCARVWVPPLRGACMSHPAPARHPIPRPHSLPLSCVPCPVPALQPGAGGGAPSASAALCFRTERGAVFRLCPRVASPSSARPHPASPLCRPRPCRTPPGWLRARRGAAWH